MTALSYGFTTADDLAAAQLGYTGWRPLLGLSYAVNRAFGGWIELNLLVHLACAVAVWLIARELFDQRVAWVSAALFAVCPLAADAVLSVSGRSSSLCALFMLFGVWCLLRGQMYWAIACGVLAFGVKEEAISFLLVWAALDYGWVLKPQHYLNKQTRWVIPATLALAGVAALLLAPRLYQASVFGTPGVAHHAALFMSSVGRFATFHQTADPTTVVSWPYVIIATLSVIALLAVWTVGGRGHRVAVALVLLSPLAAYLIAPLPDSFFEHRAYFALAGMAILFASLSQRVWPYVLGLFIALSINRAVVYSSPIRLWEDAVEHAPEKLRPHVNLTGAYAAEGRMVEAVAQAKISHELDRTSLVARNNYLQILLAMGQFKEYVRVQDGHDR